MNAEIFSGHFLQNSNTFNNQGAALTIENNYTIGLFIFYKNRIFMTSRRPLYGLFSGMALGIPLGNDLPFIIKLLPFCHSDFEFCQPMAQIYL